jgi:DNA modification methylase
LKPYYQDENTTIYCGDCAEVLPQIEQVDLTVTSPPYDQLRDYEEYSFEFEAIAKELFRITKQGGVVVWVVGDAVVDNSETGTSFIQALSFKALGFNLHDTMIYLKAGIPFPQTTRYAHGFEYMFVLSKGKPVTTNIIQDRPNAAGKSKRLISGYRQKDGSLSKGTSYKVIKETGARYNYWYLPNCKRGLQNDHPASFPEALANDHIRSWSNAGDTILDPFMGSNTTGKMALVNGCKFIGIEISEKYCEIAVKRIAQQGLNFG